MMFTPSLEGATAGDSNQVQGDIEKESRGLKDMLYVAYPPTQGGQRFGIRIGS